MHGSGAAGSVAFLLQTPQVRLSLDRAQRLVRYDRSSASFDTVEAYETMVDAVLAALAPVARAQHVILVDLRLGPIRSGGDFERAALRFRAEVFRDFSRAAVLLATQIGKLQIARHEKEQGPGPRAFTDEAEALRYLATGSSGA